MKDKICIITGATSGMGFTTALALAGMGAKLGLVSRNKERGEKVVQAISEQTKNKNISLFLADLSSVAEIKKLGASLNNFYPQIDVLVNNAGAVNPKRIVTVDGFELTFAVNHLAYFLLTNLLLDKLKSSPSARIVSVASIASRAGKIHFNDLHFEKKFSSVGTYCQSKLANIMFTYELAHRLEGSNVTANCMHPGVVKTRFAGEMNGAMRLMWKMGTPFFRSAEKGAETTIWLASSPDVEGVSGKYFNDKKETRSNRLSYNRDDQKRLWEVSEKLCGLTTHE
jgi:retinol dehydrogenase 14